MSPSSSTRSPRPTAVRPSARFVDRTRVRARRWVAAVAALALIGGLAGCAGLPAPAASPATSAATSAATAPAAPAEPALVPNANLVLQGIPPIPASIGRRLERYAEVRGKTFVAWHPREPVMLVAHRPVGGNVNQLHLLDGPLKRSRQLTFDNEPVGSASFEPVDGRYVVFSRAQGGNEAAQLYRLDLPGGQPVRLTDPDERHALLGWLPDGSRIVVASLPLDRTARDGRRSEVATTVSLIDPLQASARRVVATLPGGGWSQARVAPDGRSLAITQYRSAEDSRIWRLDLDTGERRLLIPRDPAAAPSSNHVGPFSADGRSLWITSDRDGEFMEAMRLDLDSGRVQRVSGHIPWDVGSLSASEDGRLVAARVNVEGRHELRLFDGTDGRERPATAQVAGDLTQLHVHRSGRWLAMGVNSTQGPNQIAVMDVASGRIEPWSRAEGVGTLDTRAWREQQIVRWKSFDGRTISGWLGLPPERFQGRRPVLIEIHGGPESQATVGFLGRLNYFIQEMGIAVIQPNVRGSSGFGKTFLSLDNGRLREDSVRDIGALLDWIATQPGLDPSRVIVSGGSYGGYMSLAVSVHYADRIAGSVDTVGISHFVSFLENTESYRRDLRRVEYGDERDPAMRAFLDSISPLTHAGRIRKPLFVIQGRNDPRVPYTEAEQIVARVRAVGTPVWYLRAENEGHGFARKENADFRFAAMARFIETLIGERP